MAEVQNKSAGAGKTAKKVQGEKKVAAHPPTAKMILEAVGKLKERSGSSLQAIKKYIATSFKVDVDNKLNTHIKKALGKLVEDGQLNQTKGKGASGSFKLADKAKKAEKKAIVATQRKPIKKTATSKEGGAVAAKKAAPTKKRAAQKASSSKAEKTAKAPTKKPAATKAKAKPSANKKTAASAEKKAKRPASPTVKVPKTKTLKKPTAPTKKTAPKQK